MTVTNVLYACESCAMPHVCRGWSNADVAMQSVSLIGQPPSHVALSFVRQVFLMDEFKMPGLCPRLVRAHRAGCKDPSSPLTAVVSLVVASAIRITKQSYWALRISTAARLSRF